MKRIDRIERIEGLEEKGQHNASIIFIILGQPFILVVLVSFNRNVDWRGF